MASDILPHVAAHATVKYCSGMLPVESVVEETKQVLAHVECTLIREPGWFADRHIRDREEEGSQSLVELVEASDLVVDLGLGFELPSRGFDEDLFAAWIGAAESAHCARQNDA